MAAVREASSQVVQRVAEREGRVLVDGSAPSGTENQELDIVKSHSLPKRKEKNISNGVAFGNMGAPATRDGFAPPMEEKNSG
jgi:hypothetical protein